MAFSKAALLSPGIVLRDDLDSAKRQYGDEPG